MKCVDCGKESSKKDRGVGGGRCNSCYHAFVTEPLEDGLTDMAKEIYFTGSYKTQGDKVEVAGIFHRACLEHGGDLDIHAQSLRKLENGRTVNQVLSLDKKNLSLILLGALFLLWILTLFRRK